MLTIDNTHFMLMFKTISTVKNILALSCEGFPLQLGYVKDFHFN